MDINFGRTFRQRVLPFFSCEIAKSNFKNLTKNKGDIVPKIIKAGNVRYITAVIDGENLLCLKLLRAKKC
jgi:hypothetical protein